MPGGTLTHERIATDIAAVSARVPAIVSRLVADQPGLAATLTVSAGIEVRSFDQLTLTDDFILPAGADGIGAPVLTLRAAGDLRLSFSLSDGFSGVGAAAAATERPAASFRLVGGADLSAADPLTVRDGGTGGDVIIGRTPAVPTLPAPAVFVRSTTGDIDIVAARDVRLLNNGVRLYTAGSPVDAGSLPEWARIGLASTQVLRVGGQTVGPFFHEAGNVRLSAGRDIVGSPSRQYVTDWWWRLANATGAGSPVAWWSRYDLFQQGVASFGGGDVIVAAGRDVVDLDASTPSGGYALKADVRPDGTVLPPVQVSLLGGRLDVRAGRDLVSGLLLAGGSAATTVVGGDIRPAAVTGLGASYPGLQLFYGPTRWRIDAGGDVEIGHISSTGMVPGTVQASGAARLDLVLGLDDGAALEVSSLAGNIRWTGNRTPIAPSTDSRNILNDPARQAPGRMGMVAHGGAISIRTPVFQRPTGDGQLRLLADGDLEIGQVIVAAASAPEGPRPGTRAAVTVSLNEQWRQTATAEPALEFSDRDAVRLVSRQGDLTLETDLRSARPVRALAARDVAGTGSATVVVQHQQPGDLTLLRAGRDVLLADSNTARVRVGGPGDLLILAGRDVDLRGAAGIVTVGNQDNPRLLPEGGARITVVSGVDWGGADYRTALDAGMQLGGGGAGLVGFEGELWAWLAARDGGQPVSAPGSAELAAAARAWLALPDAARTEQVRARVGDAAWADALRDAMRRYTGQRALDVDAAQQAFADLDPIRRGQIESQLRAHLVVAAAPHGEALDFTRALFAALPLEQQALRLHDVLFAELRAAGRAAARLPSGDARDAAYAPGYAALATLYPPPRRGGDIRVATSQILTQQGGEIRLIAPGGGVDAGAIGGASGKRQADLGILTAAGGNIEAVARGDFAVNQSRVFTLGRGDLLIWSSDGNIDAGRGAKTVTGAPAPVFTIDRNGNVVVDASGSFSGSGIAVLDAASALDLYAPKGEISAGEAGIASRGIAFIAGESVRGSDFTFGSTAVGAPPKPDTGGATAGLAALSSATTTASTQAAARADDEDDPRRRRAQRRNLLLEFLGFGAAE